MISIDWFGLDDPAYGKAGVARDLIWSVLEIAETTPIIPEPSTLVVWTLLAAAGVSCLSRKRAKAR